MAAPAVLALPARCGFGRSKPRSSTSRWHEPALHAQLRLISLAWIVDRRNAQVRQARSTAVAQLVPALCQCTPARRHFYPYPRRAPSSSPPNLPSASRWAIRKGRARSCGDKPVWSASAMLTFIVQIDIRDLDLTPCASPRASTSSRLLPAEMVSPTTGSIRGGPR